MASAVGLPMVSVSVSPVGEGTTLAEHGPQLSQDLGQYWAEHELVSEGEITLDDGTLAYEVVCSGTIDGNAYKCKYVIVFRELRLSLSWLRARQPVLNRVRQSWTRCFTAFIWSSLLKNK